MAFDLVATRQTVADLCHGVDRTIRVYAHVPDKPELPCVIVQPARDRYVDYHGSFDGAVDVQFVLLILVPTSADRQWQENLDRLLSSGTGQGDSLLDAVETSPNVHVTQANHLGKTLLEPDGQTMVYAAELVVTYIATR